MKVQLASTVLAVTIGIVAGEKVTTSHHPNKGRTLGHGDNDEVVVGKIGDECDKPIILPQQTKGHDSDAEDDNNGESRSNEPDAGILGGRSSKPGKEEDGGETTTTTTTTAATTSTSATTTVAPPKVEEESVPCLTREDCDVRRQSMNMPAFFTGNFPSKGCFSKNNNAFFSPGKYDEMTASPLPGMQKRIKCKKKKACVTEEECMLKKQSVGIASNRFHVGDFPTKGCFAKNNKVFFSPGTPEEMEKVNLPAAQTRLWCDDILVLSSFLEPTGMPTDTPTDKPTTQQPTVSSTNKPSVSNGPSEDPSAHPSKSHEPTKLPTASPSQSMRPTREGATSSEPIKLPSISPSQSMSPTRTVAPSSVPTKPTTSPSQSASPTRTGAPSSVPTKPTTSPSYSASPTRMGAPSSGPTKYPMPDILDTIPKDEEVYSNSPSALPSKEPTYYPTYNAIDRLPKAIADEGTAIVSAAALGGTKMVSINLGIAASLMAILVTLYV